MTAPDNAANNVASIEEIQKGWHELASRVGQLEAEKNALEQENKTLRHLVERIIDHRQKSHGELVLLLTGLVSKLPINDVGTIVARLVEHNTNVSAMLAALGKGTAEVDLPKPAVLKNLDQTKRDLQAAVKPLIAELAQLEAPLDPQMLKSVVDEPEVFFSPRVVRANRCFLKGQVPRERIVREFGEPALAVFNDVTTDPKLNPRPKPEEIALVFKNDFETLLPQNPGLLPEKREELTALYRKVQQSKASTEQARAQKNAFLKLSFLLELLHYYENQNTEAPEVIFAQRLPAVVEQLILPTPQDGLDEKLIAQAEGLMAFVINPDHRQMIVNNVGKGGAAAKTLKYVLTLRAGKVSEPDQFIPEFVKHLIPRQKAPRPESLTAVLKLIGPEMQRLIIHGIMDTDRLGKEEAQSLGKTVGKELGLTGLDAPRKAQESVPAEIERQLAWDKVKDLISRRSDPAAIATAIRDRLHAKYDADEMKQSWVVLTEADPISLIRVFCHLPYLADGRTDPVARAVMETYVTRLTHEKYAHTYNKVVNSLRNMFKANPESPTLVNFMALVKWLDAPAANKMSADVGMAVAA